MRSLYVRLRQVNIRLVLFFLIVSISACGPSRDAEEGEFNWYRGNIHTHTFWHGGRDFPENVAKWYKENGYDFLVFTEHNVIQKGEKWHSLPDGHPELEKYRKNFGDDWVEVRPDPEKEGQVLVRVKPLDEYRTMFEGSGDFLMVNGSEITDKHGVHLVAYNLDEVIPPAGGTRDERVEMIRENVRRVDGYRERTGRDAYPILCHPNWGWALTAEMINEVPDLKFFEVYNGVPESNNNGDEHRVSTDKIWDIVLAHRLSKENGSPIYGLASDDAHDYNGGINGRNVGPGKGWVMVRSQDLSEASILAAVSRGDFYSSTGVILRNIRFDGKSLRVEISPVDGVNYLTEFIGTRSGFDSSSVPTVDASGDTIPNTTRTYSEAIGEVLQSSRDNTSEYRLRGNELYVRVRITSTADQIDPFTNETIGVQRAWIQPVIPGENTSGKRK